MVVSWLQGDIRNKTDLDKLFSNNTYVNLFGYFYSVVWNNKIIYWLWNLVRNSEIMGLTMLTDLRSDHEKLGYCDFCGIALMLWSILLGSKPLVRVLLSLSCILITIWSDQSLYMKQWPSITVRRLVFVPNVSLLKLLYLFRFLFNSIWMQIILTYFSSTWLLKCWLLRHYSLFIDITKFVEKVTNSICCFDAGQILSMLLYIYLLEYILLPL